MHNYRMEFRIASLPSSENRPPVASIPGPDTTKLGRLLVHAEALTDKDGRLVEVGISGGVIPSRMETEVWLAGEDGTKLVDKETGLPPETFGTVREARRWRTRLRVPQGTEGDITVNVIVRW